MDPTSNPTSTNYQQVTVDVPEDRVAEFHAFFGRFLAGAAGRRGRGRSGRRHRGYHGHGCAERHGHAEPGETPGQTSETTEV
ncbi:MAG TPA: hypothetical protein VIX82_06785 [Solirubrobacteraceae bacterium]